MSRPVLEVADIFRAWVGRFIDRSRARLSWPQLKVSASSAAARRSHIATLFGCGRIRLLVRPAATATVQVRRKADRWVAARTREVPLNYFHVVFTVPHQLSELMLQNKRLLPTRCFVRRRHRTGAPTRSVSAPRSDLLCVLHTRGQTLIHHPHPLRRRGAASRPVMTAGFGPRRRSFCLKKLSVVYAGNSAGLRASSAKRNSRSTARWRGLPTLGLLRDSCTPCIPISGWLMSESPSADRNMCCTIWLATRTGWPSPTID